MRDIIEKRDSTIHCSEPFEIVKVEKSSTNYARLSKISDQFLKIRLTKDTTEEMNKIYNCKKVRQNNIQIFYGGFQSEALSWFCPPRNHILSVLFISLFVKYKKVQRTFEPSSENLMYESPCFLQETQNNVEKPWERRIWHPWHLD